MALKLAQLHATAAKPGMTKRQSSDGGKVAGTRLAPATQAQPVPAASTCALIMRSHALMQRGAGFRGPQLCLGCWPRGETERRMSWLRAEPTVPLL